LPVPAFALDVDHGYAITAHRSQGETVDVVVPSPDAIKQEQFHVAASPGSDGITIITSEVDGLRESLGISSARPPATELAREQSQIHTRPDLGIAYQQAQNIQPPKPEHDIGTPTILE
jgi:hypothetical protein